MAAKEVHFQGHESTTALAYEDGTFLCEVRDEGRASWQLFTELGVPIHCAYKKPTADFCRKISLQGSLARIQYTRGEPLDRTTLIDFSAPTARGVDLPSQYWFTLGTSLQESSTCLLGLLLEPELLPDGTSDDRYFLQPLDVQKLGVEIELAGSTSLNGVLSLTPGDRRMLIEMGSKGLKVVPVGPVV